MNTHYTKRDLQGQSWHDASLAAIASDRFNFGYPYYTRTNPNQEHNFWVRITNGYEVLDEFWPDIVVVDLNAPQINNLVMAAEVETEHSVNEQEVPQWTRYAQCQVFHLFVPYGLGQRARRLAAGIRVTEIWEYWVHQGRYYYRVAPKESIPMPLPPRF